MLHIDSIERELILPAAPPVVWQRSFATPEALSSWFPEKIEGEFAEGEKVVLVWGEHRVEARVVEYAPEHTLAYQWHPGDAYTLDQFPESELTTVRFTLEEHPQGTKVKLVESGFSNVDLARRESALKLNSNGWDEELAKLPKGYTE